MKRYFTIAILLTIITVIACQIVEETEITTYEAAYYAWDSGDYHYALSGFRNVLNAPDGDVYLEDIALVTGELYHVEEVSTDGGSVRFSPDGKYIVYETSAGAIITSHIANIESGIENIADFEARNVVFSLASGTISFLAVNENDEVTEARESGNPQNRNWIIAKNTRIVQMDLPGSSVQDEKWLDTGNLVITDLEYSSDGTRLFFTAGAQGNNSASDIYSVSGSSGRAQKITSGSGFKSGPRAVTGGKYLVYNTLNRNPVPQQPQVSAQGRGGGRGRGFGGRGRGGRGGGVTGFVVRDLDTGRENRFTGGSYSLAAGGSALTYSYISNGETVINFLPLDGSSNSVEIFRTNQTIGSPQISPDGRHVTFHMMTKDDYEVYVVNSDGGGELKRLSYEIQHDRYPRFITNDLVLAAKGEGRHQRSYLYDINSGKTVKLFHNNTVRTIAPEYQWESSSDGSKLLIVAERDGDTISPERGVYLLDLNRKVSKSELLERIETNLTAELDLRERGEKMFMQIFDDVKSVTGQVSTARIFGYEKDLHDFGSKNITQPGNAPAREYLFNTYESFGYEPELQWFEARGGIRTANILATLKGTEDPDIIYIVSSHFDSSPRGPGADDNTSGTVALLDAARVLSDHPMPATIVFASFTGEESGLLGSREYVRQAVANDIKLVGALNNDMLGWSENHRLDNTIRYSNAGIRDIQHAGAFLFTKLITYDALYYKSTDAAAYYEAYGDIVGGIGSYPVLGNPNYHRATDRLETINHVLIAEVSKTTVATLMLLASSPSRLKNLQVDNRTGGSADISWTASPESGVTHYIVVYGPVDNPMQNRKEVKEPATSISGIEDGYHIAVKAVNSRGFEGWDWVRTIIGN